MKKWLLILILSFGCAKHSIKSEGDKIIPTGTAGQFGGLGICINMVDEIPFIKSVIEGTPAYEAGIQPGDKIIKIEAESTKGIAIEDAVEKLRGMPGTKVSITIQREDLKNPFDCTLTRTIIGTPIISEKTEIDTLREKVPHDFSPPPRKARAQMEMGTQLGKALIRKSIVLPNWPHWAKKRELTNVSIKLKVSVDASGNIRSVIIENSSGSPQWDESVATTIKKWRCKPMGSKWDDWLEFLFFLGENPYNLKGKL